LAGTQPDGESEVALGWLPFKLTVDGKPKENKMKKIKPKNRTPFLRTITEMGFIIFLFYSNLLMGEFTNANGAQGKTLLYAIQDIFTVTNFVIAVLSSMVGHLIFEYLRKKI
jgi:hypothetical protein